MRHTGKNSLSGRERDVRVIGIDPGSRMCGYGIIDSVPNRKGTAYTYIASGRIELTPAGLLHVRLKEIYDALSEIICEYAPSEAVVEKIFFAKSVKSALQLGHARGIALLAAVSSGLPVYEYSALQVKKAVAGYGRADKNQIQQMVRVILNIKSSLSSDSADALAISICHLNTVKFHPCNRNGLPSSGFSDRIRGCSPATGK